MASRRLDALTVREKGDKKYWTKIGAAFENDRGGFNVTLDALPIDGKLFLYPPRDRNQQATGAPVPADAPTNSQPSGDDDIPF